MGILGTNSLFYATGIDNTGLASGTSQSKRLLAGLTTTANKEAAKMNKIYQNLGAAMAAYFSLTATKEFISDVVRVRGEFQQLDVALTTMLGSKEKADQMMADIIDMSIKTPFTLMDVASNTKQLMAMGIASEDVMDTIKSLGDVAAGVAVPLQRLAINYGQVATLGRLQAREIRDFAMAGVPLVEELADMLGKTTDEINAMVSAGKIGFDDVEQAFINMSSEGGKFANLMEEQMGTVTGRISNLKDAFDRMLNAIGEANEGTIYNVISLLKLAVENYEEIVKVITSVAAAYGTYKAVLISVAVYEQAKRLAPLVQTYYQLAKAIGIAKTNQFVFNQAVKLNPYVAAASAIAALVGSLVLFSKKALDAKDIQDSLQASIRQLKEEAKFQKMVSEFNDLSGKVEKTAKEQKKYNTLISKISKLHRDAVEDTNKYGEAIELNTERLKEAVTTQRENMVTVLTAQLNLAEETLNGLVEKYNKAVDKTQKEVEISYGTPDSEEEFTDYVERSDEAIDKNFKLSEKLGQEIKSTENNITTLRGMLSILTGEKAKFLDAYKDLFVDLDGLTAKSMNEMKAELEELMVIDTKGNFKTEIENQIAQIDKALENLNKKEGFDINEYTDSLDAKAKAYKAYENEVRQYGKEYADKRYADLLEEGENYTEFLTQELLKYGSYVSMKTAIAQAAAKAGIHTLMPSSEPTSLKSLGVESIDINQELKIDTSTLRGIKEWYKQWNKTVTEYNQLTKAKKLDTLTTGLMDAGYAMQDLADFASNFDDELGTILSTIGDISGSLGNIISGSITPGLSGISQMVTGIVGVASTLYNLFDNSAEQQAIAESKAQSFLDVLELQNLELEYQIDLMNELSGIDRIGAESESIDLIQEQIDALNEMANGMNIVLAKGSNKITYYFDGDVEDLEYMITHLDEIITESGKSFADFINMDGYEFENLDSITEIIDSYTELIEQRTELIEDMLGNTSATLSDSLIEGLENGLSAVDAFANTFEDAMKQAIQTSFETAYILPLAEKMMEGIYDIMDRAEEDSQYYESAEDINDLMNDYAGDSAGSISDVLNAAEDTKSQLTDLINQASDDSADSLGDTLNGDSSNSNYSDLLGQYTEDFKDSMADEIEAAQDAMLLMNDILEDLGLSSMFSDSADGLSGAIEQSITEETASVLAGLFNVMSIDVRNIYTLLVDNASVQSAKMVQSISLLTEIEANTRATATNTEELEEIKTVLKDIKSNTSTTTTNTTKR